MMPDEMPDDLAALDDAIGFDMLDAALHGVTVAERYTLERAAHIRANGIADPDSFPAWSEVSEPGTQSYGPFTPDPEP
jgi:hypothetical protein